VATITSTGVGSGLDVSTIVTSLMNLEKQPLTQLQSRASTIQSKMSAFGSLKSQIAALGDVATRLATASSWNPLRADSTGSAVSATATATAVAGSYSLEVEQLAQAQVLASTPYAASTTVVGTGTLTLDIGTTVGGVFTPKSGSTAATITIGTGQQTLAGVRDAINAANAGVTASIVTSSAGARLVLRGPSGAEGSVRLTAADDDANHTDAAGLSALAWDPAAAVGAGRNLGQTQAAQDAKFTLDGMALTSATNSPAGVLEGVTLNLKAATDAPVQLTVSVETVAVRKNINDFVNAYNSLNSMLKAQTQADPSGAARGVLQADSTATTLLTSLREMLRGTVTGLSGTNGLNVAGMELQRDGSLVVKDDRLTPLLQTPARLAALFGQAETGGDTSTRGFAVRFKAWTTALTGTDGVLDSRTSGLKRSIDANLKQQDGENAKLTRTEARLKAQYQRLDSEMTRLNGQLSQMKSALGLT